MRAVALAAGGLLAVLLGTLLAISTLLSALVSPAIAQPAMLADHATPAAPFTGDSGGCTAIDPTGGRCLTPATRHAYDEISRVFGAPGSSASALRSAGCFDEHAWNPSSDHSRGRGCDFFPGTAGAFPHGQDLTEGWQLADWLRANSDALHLRYIIWQGRFWSPITPDRNGWGRPYTGGGIYDPTDATGGHYDHIHLSIYD